MALKAKTYTAGEIKPGQSGDEKFYYAVIHSPDGLEVLEIKSKQREMVRISVGATCAALNKAMGV